MVRLHKKTFLGAWNKLSRGSWALIAIYSYTLWYLFFSWKHIYSAWKKFRTTLYNNEKIPFYQQFAHLISLAILHTIPPHFYYQYQLYRVPEKHWLDFIYTHELPHWHHMMSPSISDKSLHLMSDKHDFSIEMKKSGIPVIDTKQVLAQGTKPGHEQLFDQSSSFIKPINGSRKQGCYQLRYKIERNSYQLWGKNISALSDNNEILEQIKQDLIAHSLLLQPLLYNHPNLVMYSQCEDLITIRLITELTNGEPQVLSAVLEVPAKNDFHNVDTYSIQKSTGKLKTTNHLQFNGRAHKERNLARLDNYQLPLWQEAKCTAISAHKIFRDIRAIGWDLAITTQGIKLLEGNINWGVAPHIHEVKRSLES
ncbi:sugar-transfer associated ATP-grasp domain-containing protein [Aliikangiella coralliicola]|nr:sugar-transfer associated ATP-grasp domain-containing protein [Aliikangiella coralliicola]